MHSLLTEYILAHVWLVAVCFKAACKDSNTSPWMFASVNHWRELLNKDMRLA